MSQKLKPRILYLDIDDCIVRFPEQADEAWVKKYPDGEPAPGAIPFLRWAQQNFEVRWLTSWSLKGELSDNDILKISGIFLEFPYIFRDIKNPKPWWNTKVEGIDTDDPRPWVWVEDELISYELDWLRKNTFESNYFYANTSKNAYGLFQAWAGIAKKFELPVTLPKWESPVDPKSGACMECGDYTNRHKPWCWYSAEAGR